MSLINMSHYCLALREFQSQNLENSVSYDLGSCFVVLLSTVVYGGGIRPSTRDGGGAPIRVAS